MPIIIRLALTATITVIALLVPKFVSAQSNIMFILDGSNSMWGQVDGVAKIETAKKALSGMLLDLPAGTKAGLMAYGHTSTDDCTDVQVLAPIGSTDAKGLVGKLQSVVPKGKTPITYALETSAHQFAKDSGNNIVVLVSDGLETCGGNACQVAGSLAKKGFHIKIHVVGFDVNKEERNQLQCIAEAGGGRYFNADTAAGFKEAIQEVKEEVRVAAVEPDPKPEAKPKPAGPKEVFRDDFDGEELADHWGVVNPDPDAFLVEEGGLLIVNGTPGDRAKLDFPNLFKLADAMPKGNWVVTMKFDIELQTGWEVAYIGLVNHPNDALYVMMTSYNGKYDENLNINGIKRSKGKEKKTGQRLYKKRGKTFGEAMKAIPQPIFLRLRKTGRAYVGSIKFGEDSKAEWTTLDKLTVLRQRGKFVFGLYQSKKTTGESTMTVDWVKIETLEK